MPQEKQKLPWKWEVFGFALCCLVITISAVVQQTGPADPSRTINPKTIENRRRGTSNEEVAAALHILEFTRARDGSHHTNTLFSMEQLANLYYTQKRYDEAEPLFREALQLSREVLGPHHPRTLNNMNGLAFLYHAQGRYNEAEPLYRELLQLCREVLGPRHRATLAILNNLASLYYDQGHYDKAEPLYRETLQLHREILGPRHPDTLIYVDNLALLYHAQGRYDETEPLYREALQLRREVLGPRHPDTLANTSRLADLYKLQKRYDEAKPLYSKALQLRREVLGPRHPDTLISMDDLALLYIAQGRYDEAELLFREALQLRREVLGPRHIDTLTSMSNLAFLYQVQGFYGKSEPLNRETLRLRREVLGPRHPHTLDSLNNLALMYQGQGRNDEAEPLYREALKLRREVLGPRHTDTLQSMNNLALVYLTQGRDDEAEPLYREALQISQELVEESSKFSTLMLMDNLASLYLNQGKHSNAKVLFYEALQLRRKVLGLHHPDTLFSKGRLADVYRKQGRHDEAEPLYREALKGTQGWLSSGHPSRFLLEEQSSLNLIALGRVADAVQQLRAMKSPLLTRLGAELSDTEAPRARRYATTLQIDYQNIVLNLALSPKAGPDATSLAASVALGMKKLRTSEDAYLAHIARQSQDPKARAIAADLTNMHSQLAALFHGEGKAAEITTLIARLQTQEVALAQVSREYGQQLQARELDPADLRAHLAPRAALLDLHEYHPIDFRTDKRGPAHWAGTLLHADGLRVVDLGPAEPTAQAAQALLDDLDSPAGRQAAAALHEQLLGPFKAELAGLDRLYVAPDGLLHLVPFAALLGPDGRRLAERLDLRLLQAGRDLLRPDPDPADAARGLLALGGIDFDAAEPSQAASATGPAPTTTGVSVAELRSRTAAAIQSFPALPGTAEEVRGIAALYRSVRPGEPVTVWQGAAASEARLRALEQPPRVLHLATHGFYRPAGAPSDRPLLLSGVALAGANRALRDAGQDGILYAIEAQDLNLEGTELVVLSACETGQGQVDYGEGVSGLVQALRTAGARHVLVTLRPVSDEGAASFMESFYRHWLGQARSDPAAAFQAAQREAIRAASGSPAGGDPTWAQFVLVGK